MSHAHRERLLGRDIQNTVRKRRLYAYAGAALLQSLMVGISSVSAQTALHGRVLDAVGERPLANANITGSSAKLSTRSDSAGRFILSSVPPGPQVIAVRLVGYEPWSGVVNFPDTGIVDVEVLLEASGVRLPTVDVSASYVEYATRLRDFEERRRIGLGRFITRDVFERSANRRMSELLLERIAGIRLVGLGAEQVVHSTRDGKPRCPVQVVLNDMTIYNGGAGQKDFDINSINPGDVLGVEFYTTANVPARFGATSGSGGGANCGTVVIWTK